MSDRLFGKAKRIGFWKRNHNKHGLFHGSSLKRVHRAPILSRREIPTTVDQVPARSAGDRGTFLRIASDVDDRSFPLRLLDGHLVRIANIAVFGFVDISVTHNRNSLFISSLIDLNNRNGILVEYIVSTIR